MAETREEQAAGRAAALAAAEHKAGVGFRELPQEYLGLQKVRRDKIAELAAKARANRPEGPIEESDDE